MNQPIVGQSKQIKELLKRAKSVLIASHENPDPDAVGSVLALHQVFKKMGLKSSCYSPNPPPKYLKFLPDFFEIQIKNETKRDLDFSNFDFFFCLDYGDFRRLHLPDSLHQRKLITIDHHLGDQRGEIKIIHPEISSTAEIIYNLLKEIKTEINKDIATCLLTGMVFDTGLFSHFSTSSQTISITADLLSKGVPFTKIIRHALNPGFQPHLFSQYAKIWGKVLSRIKFDEKTGLVYSWISYEDFKEYRDSLPDLTRILSIISSAFPASLTLFLVEYKKGEVRGSLRSEPFKGKNVASLATALGGGGHLYAAGFKQKGTIEEVLKKVMELIE